MQVNITMSFWEFLFWCVDSSYFLVYKQTVAVLILQAESA